MGCATAGNYRLLEFLRTHYYEGVRADETIAEEAASNGHLDMLRQMKNNGYTVLPSIGGFAINGDYVDVLKYAVTLGYELNNKCLVDALDCGSEQCVKYLISKGIHEFPVDDDKHSCDPIHCKECDPSGMYKGLISLDSSSVIESLLSIGALKSSRILYIYAAQRKNHRIILLLMQYKMPVPHDVLCYCGDFNTIYMLHRHGALLEYVDVRSACYRHDTETLRYLKQHGINMRWQYYECVSACNCYAVQAMLSVLPEISTLSIFCDAWDAWVKAAAKRTMAMHKATDFDVLSLALDYIQEETDDFRPLFTDEMAFACVVTRRMGILYRFWEKKSCRVEKMLIHYGFFKSLKVLTDSPIAYIGALYSDLAALEGEKAVRFRETFGYCPRHHYASTAGCQGCGGAALMRPIQVEPRP